MSLVEESKEGLGAEAKGCCNFLVEWMAIDRLIK